MKIETLCAICKSRPPSTVVYRERIDAATFTADTFSARRQPDRRHYQWVRCDACGLMRSDPVEDVDLASLYASSTFDYSNETDGLKETYRALARRALGGASASGTVLEIGGGNGFFLDAVAQDGFDRFVEVEPSRQAVDQASALVREHAICDIMRPGLVPDGSVDLVAMFHVLDHLPDPRSVLETAFASLKPGGHIVIAVHDVEAWSARLMKERSPIFDVEHTYLYSRTTGPQLLASAGFSDVRAGTYANRYSGAYLLHLAPFPSVLKGSAPYRSVSQLARRVRFTLPLGNMWIAGRRAS